MTTDSHVPDPPRDRALWSIPLIGVAITWWIAWFGPGNLDLGLHLAMGRHMSELSLFPHHDPFTYTTRGVDFVNFEWLFDLILYQIHQLSGMAGLFALKLALIGVTIWSLLRSAAQGREHGEERIRSLLIALCLLLLALPLLKIRLVIRPHLVGYALLLVTLQLCRRLHRGAGSRSSNRSTWLALFLLTVVWVNSHGSWPLALVVSGLFLCCFSETRQIFAKTAVVQTAALLVNPYGAKLLWVPFSHLGSSPVHHWIEEWMPPSHLLLSYQMGLTIAFVAAFLLLIVGVRKRSDLPEVILATLLGIMTLRSYRFLAPALLVAIPPMATRLSTLVARSSVPRRLVIGALASASAFCLVFAGKQRQAHPRAIEWNQVGLPVSAADFINRNKLPGPLFNDFDVGDYLCWPLGETVKHTIDGRVDLFQETGLQSYVNMLKDPANTFEAHVQEHDVQMVLLGWTVPRNAALVRWLQEIEGFVLIHLDEGYAIWARGEARRVATKRELVLDRVQPALSPFQSLLGAVDPTMGEQIARIRASSSDRFGRSLTIEWLWRSALQGSGAQITTLAQLVQESNALLEQKGLAPVVLLHARTRRGQALLRLGKNEEALLDLEPAVRAFRRLEINRPEVEQDLTRAQETAPRP